MIILIIVIITKIHFSYHYQQRSLTSIDFELLSVVPRDDITGDNILIGYLRAIYSVCLLLMHVSVLKEVAVSE